MKATAPGHPIGLIIDDSRDRNTLLTHLPGLDDTVFQMPLDIAEIANWVRNAWGERLAA